MSHATANKAILENAYRRWNETRGDSVEELLDICAEEILWGSLAGGVKPLAFTAKAVGKSDVRNYFEGLLAAWSMNYYNVDYFVAEDDRVVVVGSTKWTNKQTGKACETPKTDIWRFRDGRAIEFFEYYDTAQILDAAKP
ncbi:nuclear transport factor 2 family protein [Labrys okinawensis]|uniref:nuclear transport factor 2 family protein n=1 Tax=Labrys okinawensis TaxID=346911 RepID=UPI0039BC9A36